MTEPQPERKSSPGLAKLMTVVVVALVGFEVVTTQQVDPVLGGMFVVVLLFWAGQTIDSFLPFR